MNKIETSINIKATPEEVWRVFSSFPTYPEWSSFIESIKGDLEVDSTLEIALKPPNKDKATIFKPKILKVDPTKEFRWLGKFGGINFLFVGEHYFIFEKAEEGTKLTHGEKFKGILVPVLKNMLLDTKKGFENFNQALKERSERS